MCVTKCLQVLLVMAGLWIHLTKCYYYCDDDVGICLYTNKTFVTRWEEAHEQCRSNGSILLEIYNENYKEVVIKAVKNFGLEGWYLLLGLKYEDGQFRWSSGKNMTLNLNGMDLFNGICSAFLILNGPELFVFPTCDNKPLNHYFVCLQVVNNSAAETHDNNYESQGSTSINPLFTTPRINSNISSRKLLENVQPLNDQQQINNIGIGVGVGVTLLIIVISLITLVIYYRKKRSNSSTEVCKEISEITENVRKTNENATDNKSSSNMNFSKTDIPDDKHYERLVTYENHDHHYAAMHI